MPILELDYIKTVDSSPRQGLAQRVADAAGEVLAAAPGSTWVKLRALAREDYAENGSELAEDLAPVFVRVLLAQPPEAAARILMARQLADAVARCFQRPADQVHILFEPAALGRIAFGGVLRQ